MRSYLSDSQLALLERNPAYRACKECPVCGDSETHENTGEYFYKGKRHECPDDDYGHVALRLAKTYWMSFIPLEYQFLLWDEYPHPDVKQDIDDYLEKFGRFRVGGIGVTVYGSDLGTGKTWAATHALKELAKKGYDCHFASFLGVRGYYDLDDKSEREFKIKRIREAEVLLLDEVKKPLSDAQRNFFEDTLEELLRERTYMNFPTLVTSNMDLAQFEREYPRCFSLLAGKNLPIKVKGEDARANGVVFEHNVQLFLKGERRPIT